VVQPTNPIIVRVIEEPAESTTVADVLLGSLGLAGALILAAAILGLLLGGVLIGIKLLRARYNLEPVTDLQELRVTPGATRQSESL
jgi:hypothetical protein